MLQALAPKLVVIEATGGYEKTIVASAVAAAHLPLAVVNPRQIRDFARATGKLAKTDRLDAAAIAHFAEAVRPAPRPIADPEAQALGELVARRQVIEMMVTVRCPQVFADITLRAGGLWEPVSHRWLVERRRIGPVIRALQQATDPLFRHAGMSLD